jgi:hypothetical protein
MNESDLLTGDDVELLAAVFVGDLDADELQRRIAEQPGRALRLSVVATGLSRAAAETLAPVRRDMTPPLIGAPDSPAEQEATLAIDGSSPTVTVVVPATYPGPNKRPPARRRRIWLTSAAALVLLAGASWLYEFAGFQGEIDRRNIVYSLGASQVRGANGSARREWVVRIERSSPAVVYFVRLIDGVPSLERGQLSVPAQRSYVLTLSTEAAEYWVLMVAPDGPTGREGVERILRGLGKCGPDWSDRLGASLAAAGEPWFALGEIELPEIEP